MSAVERILREQDERIVHLERIALARGQRLNRVECDNDGLEQQLAEVRELLLRMKDDRSDSRGFVRRYSFWYADVAMWLAANPEP